MNLNVNMIKSVQLGNIQAFTPLWEINFEQKATFLDFVQKLNLGSFLINPLITIYSVMLYHVRLNPFFSIQKSVFVGMGQVANDKG